LWVLDGLIPAELVKPADDERGFAKPVAGAGGFQLVFGQNVEGQLEALPQFVLPLFGQIARANNHGAVKVATDQQLLHEQTGHDGLAGARIVSQEEAQGLPWKQLAVNSRDLVGQRVNQGGMDREDRVKEVCEADTAGLGGELETRAVSVEAPGLTALGDLQCGFAIPVQ